VSSKPTTTSTAARESLSTSGRTIRIAFVLTEFVVGGAEMMLWKLVSRMDRNRFTPLVVGLSPRVDVMLQRFTTANVDCRVLGISRAREAPMGLLRLASALRQFRPDLVQGWLYHANIAATVASWLVSRRTPVMWSIRGAPDWDHLDNWQKRLTRWTGKKLSPLARRIIHNSLAGAVGHEQLGYAARNRVVLPNGFDTVAFQPSNDARQTLRRALNVHDDAVLVGLIGRYDPLKDHRNFLCAARLLKQRYPSMHVVLAGERLERSNEELGQLIRDFGLADRVHLLGLRNDINQVTAALDISVLSSSSEGFPNVIGEAMSCEIPCVVTNVGDCAWIVGDTGKIVPPHDSQGLAKAIGELLELGPVGRAAVGKRARARIIQEFSLDSVVRRYEDLYEAVCLESRAEQSPGKSRARARSTAK
jgi:glycosyltransferase involved in cell wall biosynthesis